jgi:hypothetical protein
MTIFTQPVSNNPFHPTRVHNALDDVACKSTGHFHPVWSKSWCPYCGQVKAMFDKMGRVGCSPLSTREIQVLATYVPKHNVQAGDYWSMRASTCTSTTSANVAGCHIQLPLDCAVYFGGHWHGVCSIWPSSWTTSTRRRTSWTRWRQGLTLVHFSAQLKRILWHRGAFAGC